MINQEQFKITSLIVKLGNSVTNYRNIKMEDIDLTSAQSDALIATLRQPGITASQVKKNLQLSQSTVAGIISRLEHKGLLAKSIDHEDGRKTILNPTKQRYDIENDLKKIALDTQNTLVQGMSDKEQQEFMRLLEIALQNLQTARHE